MVFGNISNFWLYLTRTVCPYHHHPPSLSINCFRGNHWIPCDTRQSSTEQRSNDDSEFFLTSCKWGKLSSRPRNHLLKNKSCMQQLDTMFSADLYIAEMSVEEKIITLVFQIWPIKGLKKHIWLLGTKFIAAVIHYLLDCVTYYFHWVCSVMPVNTTFKTGDSLLSCSSVWTWETQYWSTQYWKEVSALLWPVCQLCWC